MENGDSATIVFGRAAAQLRTPIMAMRARQTQRIRDIRAALIDSGFVSLDQQAAALGLSRSTTWAILQGNHKCTGLRAALVARMLASPRLPRAARTTLLNYIHQKSQGAYGHNDLQCQRFIAQLERCGPITSAWNGSIHRSQ
jgi:hypothetical protein